jgi:hypothetical protein
MILYYISDICDVKCARISDITTLAEVFKIELQAGGTAVECTMILEEGKAFPSKENFLIMLKNLILHFEHQSDPLRKKSWATLMNIASEMPSP